MGAGNPRSFERRLGFGPRLLALPPRGLSSRLAQGTNRHGHLGEGPLQAGASRPARRHHGSSLFSAGVFVAVDEVDKVLPEQRRLVLGAPL